MIKIMENRKVKVMEKYLIPINSESQNLPVMEVNYLPTPLPVVSPFANNSFNELGKELLKASADGDVLKIEQLLKKGSPFIADWIGTTPLHLAAQNNHLAACEKLINAGLSKDAGTKVERTPLHMAVYEGHYEIVEYLLSCGADPDCKDMLNMTPLHWAVQQGHADLVEVLIKYGASKEPVNKFQLTPIDIAKQMKRRDIANIINAAKKCDFVTYKEEPPTYQIRASVDEDNPVTSHLEPIVSLTIQDDPNKDASQISTNMKKQNSVYQSQPGKISIENIVLDENSTRVENGLISIDAGAEDSFIEVSEDIMEPDPIDSNADTEEVEVTQRENNYTESMRILQQHGITMLPDDDTNILSGVMESGHSVILTEAGKQALNAIKPIPDLGLLVNSLNVKTNPSAENEEEIQCSTLIGNSDLPVITKPRKIINVTREQFIALTKSGNLQKPSSGPLKFTVKPKKFLPVHQHVPIQKTKGALIIKKKNIPLDSSIRKVSKVISENQSSNVDELIDELQKAYALINAYEKQLRKSNLELAKIKRQLKLALKLTNVKQMV